MAFKATRYFVFITVLIIAGTRYMNLNQQRINMNDGIGIWDTKDKDGLRYTIIIRSNETGGQYFVAHLYCTPKGEGFYPGKPCSLPMHFHDTQDKELEVLSGVMMVDLNGTHVQLPLGEKRTVPAGLPHTLWNRGSEPMEVLMRVTPGVPSEGILEMIPALSQQFGGLNKVNPMQLVVLFVDYGITLTDIPEPLWLAAKKFLAPLARLMGFRSLYPAYVSKSGQPLPVTARQDEPAVEAAVPVEDREAKAPAAEPAAAVEAPAAEAEAEVVAEALEAATEEVEEADASVKTEL